MITGLPPPVTGIAAAQNHHNHLSVPITEQKKMNLREEKSGGDGTPPPPGEEPAKKLGLKIRGDLAGGKMAPNVANVQARNAQLNPDLR